MQRYIIYPRGGEPILFEIGSRVEAALKPWGATWLEGKIRPAISWGRGNVPREVNAAKKSHKTLNKS
jgi:hypothetical protein